VAQQPEGTESAALADGLEEPSEGAESPEDKRVSWAELYFDLVFAFAVGQTAHIMVTSPGWSGLGRAFGLFMPLWWTWVGFVVLCNRYPDRNTQRLFLLAGTLPCAVAAIENHAAAHGQLMAFTFALAAARLVLAAAFASSSSAARQVASGYAVSTVAFTVAAFVPAPWCFLLWAFALVQEAGFLLLRDGGAPRAGQGERRRIRDRTREQGRPGNTERLRAMFRPPADPERKMDTSHLAERFGAMIIILLGELVASVAGSVLGVPDHSPRFWFGLLGGLVLGAALFWIYFTAAAPMNETVLRASGGNPAMAYGLYAAGHLTPAFALLSMAAGVSLTLSGEAPQPAAWFLTGAMAAYLLGNRVMFIGKTPPLGRGKASNFGTVPRLALAALTACIALLEPLISVTGVVLVTAAWAAAIAADLTWRMPSRLRDITADPLSFFGPRKDDSPAG
jgi:low temperature requirement protein LtrA